MTNQKRICLWSGPQHPARALALAFAQRSDAAVIDRPFHAHFLRRTGLDIPGREEILDSLESRPSQIIQQINDFQGKDILLINNMPHHMIGVNLDFLNDFTHIFLIKHPQTLLSFLVEKQRKISYLEKVYDMQDRLFHYLESQGHHSLVIDASSFVLHPKEIMSLICQRVGLPFQEEMMRWYQDEPLSKSKEKPMNKGKANGLSLTQWEESYNHCYQSYINLLIHASIPLSRNLSPLVA